MSKISNDLFVASAPDIITADSNLLSAKDDLATNFFVNVHVLPIFNSSIVVLVANAFAIYASPSLILFAVDFS
jgi:hypothetical protein